MTAEDLPEAPPSVPYDEAAHDAYYAAEDAGTRVENNAVNLRFLLTSLYTSAGGAPDPQSDRFGDYLDCLLDAAEGRPFIPFDTIGHAQG